MEGRGRGGGVWAQNVCVPKMARPHSPDGTFRFVPRWPLWWGAGVPPPPSSCGVRPFHYSPCPSTHRHGTSPPHIRTSSASAKSLGRSLQSQCVLSIKLSIACPKLTAAGRPPAVHVRRGDRRHTPQGPRNGRRGHGLGRVVRDWPPGACAPLLHPSACAAAARRVRSQSVLRGGGSGMTSAMRCCLQYGPLATRRPPFPRTFSPPAGIGAHRPLIPLCPPSPSAWPTLTPLLNPFPSLGRLCQRSPRAVPASLPRVGSARRRATALAMDQFLWGGGGGGKSFCTKNGPTSFPDGTFHFFPRPSVRSFWGGRGGLLLRLPGVLMPTKDPKNVGNEEHRSSVRWWGPTHFAAAPPMRIPPQGTCPRMPPLPHGGRLGPGRTASITPDGEHTTNTMPSIPRSPQPSPAGRQHPGDCGHGSHTSTRTNRQDTPPHPNPLHTPTPRAHASH